MPKLPFLLAFALLPLCVFSQQKDEYKIAAIGFYNLENLFDTLDSPNTNDIDFTPAGRLLWDTPKYLSKQGNMARVISLLGTELNPDGVALLGVAEVENRKVLDDLVAQPALAARQYRVVHHESPDERGIDCGLLYNPKYFTLLGSRPVAVPLKNPKDTTVDHTRDILYVAGRFDGEPLHVMVCHWPSRRGGEKASEWARMAAATRCKQVADSIRAKDPDAKIIVMGDLNDDPDNKSLTEGLHSRSKLDDVETGDFYNLMFEHFKNGNGTLAYRDAWNLFDQMLVSRPLVNKKSGGWQVYKSIVFNQPWLLQTEGAFRGYPFRTFVGDLFINGYSDHLPVYFFLLKKK